MNNAIKNKIVTAAVYAAMTSCLVTAYLVVRNFNASDFTNLENLFERGFLWLIILVAGVFYLVSFHLNVLHIVKKITADNGGYPAAAGHAVLFLVINIIF